MGQKTAEFTLGLRALTELTDGTVYVCKSSQADVPGAGIDRVQVESFDGPHPAGLVGTHIHFLDPGDLQKQFGTSDIKTFVRSDLFSRPGCLIRPGLSPWLVLWFRSHDFCRRP